jgi:hypothetical protein
MQLKAYVNKEKTEKEHKWFYCYLEFRHIILHVKRKIYGRDYICMNWSWTIFRDNENFQSTNLIKRQNSRPVSWRLLAIIPAETRAILIEVFAPSFSPYR